MGPEPPPTHHDPNQPPTPDEKSKVQSNDKCALTTAASPLTVMALLNTEYVQNIYRKNKCSRWLNKRQLNMNYIDYCRRSYRFSQLCGRSPDACVVTFALETR